MHQGIRGNMLHLQYKHNRLCLFGILREGKSKYSYIILTYCPLGTSRDNSSSSHDVSRSTRAQMSGRALCDICASAPVSERTRVILRESMGWGLTCVLPSRIYCLLRYFLWGGGWVAAFCLTSASISMICVRATRTPWCDLWQMSDECSPTCRSKHSQSPSDACVDHEASHPGRHSQGIRGLQDNRWIIYFKWTHKVSFYASCRLNLGASNE